MALVNIDTALHVVKQHMKNCREAGGVEIMSYKRNRTVAAIKLGDGTILVRENGYKCQEWAIEQEQLTKKLKTLFKREFPRSRKLRLFKFESSEELDRIHQKI